MRPRPDPQAPPTGGWIALLRVSTRHFPDGTAQPPHLKGQHWPFPSTPARSLQGPALERVMPSTGGITGLCVGSHRPPPTHTHFLAADRGSTNPPPCGPSKLRCPARVSESHCLRALKPCPRSHRVITEPALGPGLPVPTPGCVHITDCWAGSPHTCRGPATVPSEPLWGETSHHRGHCLLHGAQSSLHDTPGFCPCPSQHPPDPSRPLGLQNEAGDPWDPLAHKAPTPALGFGQAPVAGVSWVRVQLPRAVPRKLSLS